MKTTAVTPVVLGLLAHGPRSGYDIKAAVDRSTRFFWAASYGQIYPELRRLEREGLVEGEHAPRGGSSGTSAPEPFPNRGQPSMPTRRSRGGLLGLGKPRLLLVAPRDVELGVRDAVAEHEIDERRVVARTRLDLAQEREEFRMASPAHA